MSSWVDVGETGVSIAPAVSTPSRAHAGMAVRDDMTARYVTLTTLRLRLRIFLCPILYCTVLSWSGFCETRYRSYIHRQSSSDPSICFTPSRPFPSLPFPSLPFPSLPFPLALPVLVSPHCLHLLEG